MRYLDEKSPQEKDFGEMILTALGMQGGRPTTRRRSNEKRKMSPDSEDTAWRCFVETSAELVEALETVGTWLMEHKHTNGVAIVVLSVHGWIDGVSVHRGPRHDEIMKWKEVMGRLQVARWTALGVLLMIDCCNAMLDLPDASADATLELTQRLGLSGLGT